MDDLIALLSQYTSIDLASKVAALQLVPENAGRLVRLHVLTECVSRLSPDQLGKNISRGQLRKLCNQSPLAQSFWARMEDPPEDLFTASLTFVGGSYIVFPGIVDDGVEITRLLGKAIFLHRDDFPDRLYARTARGLIQAVLVLSNAVAMRAGLSRWQEPDDSKRSVIIPIQERLDALADASTFSDEQLSALLTEVGLSPTVLDSLTQSMGTRQEPIDYENLSVFAKPILSVRGKKIVLAPGELLAALRHQLICLAQERDVVDDLARRYRLAAWNETQEMLSRFGITYLSEAPGDAPNGPFVDGLFRVDFDKSLYVQLVCDDFANYDSRQVYGSWERPDLVTLLETRQRAVEAELFGSPGEAHPNQSLTLIVLQSIGRMTAIGFGGPLEPFRSTRLLLSLSDLESISEVEHGDSLVLWNFAQASERVRDQTQIVQTSTLDEFAMYRARDYSYYFSDDRRPDWINIVPGSGAKLRFQGKRERDYHAIQSMTPNHVIEVTNIYGDPAIPIYGSLSQFGTRSASAVEHLPILIWVTSPPFDNEEARGLRSIYILLTDAVSYWLWQLTPSIAPLLEPLAGRFEKLLILVELEPSSEWRREASILEQPLENDLGLRHDVTIPSVTILFRFPFMRRLTGPDNSGERYLMQRVVQELRALVEDLGVSPNLLPDNEDIDLMIDRHAPLGLKKKCIVVGSTLNPALDGHNVPDFRAVSKAEINILLDKLGDYLRNEYGLPEGPIPDERREEVLRKVVEFYYQKLGGLVATLGSDEALPFFIARQETNTHESADRHLKIPTRLACFGTETEMVKMLSEEIPEVNAANQCARFIIEYLAARPPQGIRPMSLSVYDQLLAIADQLISWAYVSDLIHFGIADLKLDILPSGRLGLERARFQAAQDRFLERMSLSEIIRAAGRMPHYWREPDPSQSSAPQRFDVAFQEEFGYSLLDFGTLIGEIFRAGAEQDSPVKFVEEDVLIQRLVDRTNLSEDKVRQIASDLTLGSRENFLVPPEGFLPNDVYPWRFTRPLSYIRRPLIKIVQPARALIAWGNRHLYEAGGYLISIILDGRFQPRTPELKQFIANIHEAGSIAFNDRVAEAFEQINGLKVGRRVKKFGKKRIQGREGDLGDIDVLVINPLKKRVLLTECKDFEIARNPREYARELTTLFRGEENRPSTLAKHQRRVDWVKQNLTEVLKQYNIQRDGRWHIDSLIVVSEETFSPHLFPSATPVISFEALIRDFIPGWK